MLFLRGWGLNSIKCAMLVDIGGIIIGLVILFAEPLKAAKGSRKTYVELFG